MTPADLQYLIDLCDREVNRCGLDTEAGRRAKEMRERLERMKTVR